MVGTLVLTGWHDVMEGVSHDDEGMPHDDEGVPHDDEGAST